MYQFTVFGLSISIFGLQMLCGLQMLKWEQIWVVFL